MTQTFRFKDSPNGLLAENCQGNLCVTAHPSHGFDSRSKMQEIMLEVQRNSDSDCIWFTAGEAETLISLIRKTIQEAEMKAWNI